MPSLFKVAALAAFAAVASAQYSNSTGPVAAVVPGRTYLGCYSQQTTGLGVPVETSSFMTDERCALDCSAYTYSLVSGNNCYCSQSLNGTVPVAEALCNTRCPGNPGEACGGSSSSPKRQAAGSLLTVYQLPAIVPAGTIYETIINNYYIAYCPTCIGGTTTIGYCSIATVTACGCTTQTTPAISYTTVTVPCTIASTATVLTLTVPAGGVVTTVPATSTVTVTAGVPTTVGAVVTTVSACPGCVATTTAPVVVATTAKATYTGAASAQKVGSGLLGAAVAAAAFL